jgi:hypothetical protein
MGLAFFILFMVVVVIPLWDRHLKANARRDKATQEAIKAKQEEIAKGVK